MVGARFGVAGSWALRAAALALAVLAAPGCQGPQPGPNPSGGSSGRLLGTGTTTGGRTSEIDASRVAARDDIVSISQFWQPVPWLYDSDRGAVGFKVPVYFVSAQTERGAFVSGAINCHLYTVERGADGQPQRVLRHSWRLDENEAMKFRVRKVTVMGYPYNFYLTWPDDLKLQGRDIEVQFSYERKDGRVISGAPRRFKVAS
ncbi:MAG: hypothetical protein LC135_00145 [Phycisphaerae bacterium]|nr:hypothetical protein [Phycisphaerae bacterium]MCZ2398262.1 hypothetical protein [Phycisphaerae bacterium]